MADLRSPRVKPGRVPVAATRGMVVIPCQFFDLDATLNSGQVFHWSRKADGYEGLIGSRPVYVEACPGGVRVRAKDAPIVSRYFAIDHDLKTIHATFPSDTAMTDALASCGGMRIIRQPEWECLATFITSSMKQVPHIRAISLRLRERYGRPVRGSTVAAYPTPQALADAGESELRSCGLGYRAKTLHGTAVAIAEGTVKLAAIRTMDDADARAELMRLPGVGEKVANCVLLFGYERLGAFPVDTWIARILREKYNVKATAGEMRAFAARYFGPHGGYAQQYLFHHARSMKRRGGAAERRAA